MNDVYYKASAIFPTIGDVVVKANVFDIAEYLTDKDLWKVSSQPSTNSVTVTNIVTNQVVGFQLQELYLISRAECDTNDGSLVDRYLTPLVKAKIYDVVVFEQDDKHYIGIVEKVTGIHAPSATVRLQVTGKRVEVLVERLTLVSHYLHLEQPITLSEARDAKAKREEEKEVVRKEEINKYCKYANVDAIPEIEDKVVFSTSDGDDYYYNIHHLSAISKIVSLSENNRMAEIEFPVNYDHDFTFWIPVSELYYVGERKQNRD